MSNHSEKKGEGAACRSSGGGSGSGLGKWICIVLAVAIVGVLIAKNAGKKPRAANSPAGSEAPVAVGFAGAAAAAPAAVIQGKAIPRLVDLGASKCIPCKMMAPILEDLKNTYAGRMDVQFIDVWENPNAGRAYGIRVIPTQIFYDASGRELFRHEGFMSKEDILAKWKALGVDLKGVAE